MQSDAKPRKAATKPGLLVSYMPLAPSLRPEQIIAARGCILGLASDWATARLRLYASTPSMRSIAAMRALLLLCCAAAFDYKSISVNAPRRIVTQDDIDAKFEEVDKPYALYPVDGPAEEGLCVLAEISLTAPGFTWKRDNYIVELLDDQAEPFAAVSTGICDAGMKAESVHEFSFPIDIDMRAALLPEFGDLEQGTTCACRVAVRRVVDKQLVRMRRLLQYAVPATPTPSSQRRTTERPTRRRRSSATACGRARSRTPRLSPAHCSRPLRKTRSGATGAQSLRAKRILRRTPSPRSCWKTVTCDGSTRDQ